MEFFEELLFISKKIVGAGTSIFMPISDELGPSLVS